MAIEYQLNAELTPVMLAEVFEKSGIARALTDFSWCCYLSDLAVDKDYRQRGIGKELIARVRAEAGEDAFLLLSAPEAVAYSPKIGMEAVTNGWMWKRRSVK